MITPQDIETKMFKMSFRGYSTTEVDEFLQEICDSYVELYEENKTLKKKAGLLSDAVGQYKSMEGTLQDALSVADKSADRIEKAAGNKADEIIKNAELTARSIVAGAKQKISDEEYRLERIKREIELYKAKVLELLNAQLCVLKEYPQSGSFNAEEPPAQQMWNKKTDAVPDSKIQNSKTETKNNTKRENEDFSKTKVADAVKINNSAADLSDEDTQELETIND